MYNLALVMIGGACGSALRYVTGLVLPPSQGAFPWSTFTVNIIGSFALGLLVGASLTSTSLSRSMMLLLGTGICGGFTTYSAFAVESALLAQEGHFSTVAIYIISTLTCCACAAIAGVLAPRMLSH